MQSEGIYVEFADPDYLVLMFTPQIGIDGLAQLEDALKSLPQRNRILEMPPILTPSKPVMSPREAALCPFEAVPITECLGRILARSSVGCPPAVPIVICGEEIDNAALSCFSYYGIEHCNVVIP